MIARGVIAGSDANLEWLLPWWWDHYSTYNTYPVTFFDYGMSPAAKQWCEKRGALIQLKPISITPKEKLSHAMISQWEEIYSPHIWESRSGWFQKPQSLLASPYETSLWLDLDCEVCGSLDSLFDSLTLSLALVRECHSQMYNSGVILFRKKAHLLQAWLEKCQTEHHLHMGDQGALAPILEAHPQQVQTLPSIYNWEMSQGANFEALIIHWVGRWGKEYIRKFGGFHNLKREEIKGKDF